ncbi:MAG: redoxin domain-containing protein [Clostridia bacterium]|nr:redoxin domain-containing protein [Clostridia bacterium]
MKLSKNTKRLLIILGVAIVFALSLMIASLLLKGKDPQPALNITGVAEDGSLTSLSDHFGKKATVLLFFDVETPKALELLEQIDALAPKYDAEVMAVACHGKMEEQKKKLSELEIAMSNIIYDVEGSAVKTYNVGATPVTYFIDKFGMVREVFLSSITDKTLEKALAALD